MSTTQSQARGLGRPAGGTSDRVRADLLDAARQHFMNSEFKAVSVRQIAETAGVNGAMVSYYFGGKQGLYSAMIQGMVESLEQSLEQLSSGEDFGVADFSRVYTRVIAENPWWPNFVVREVLFGQGQAKESLIQGFSSTIAPKLLLSIEREKSSGHYRGDLNPALALISIMGMTVFPFLSKPLVETVLQMNIDDDMVEELSTHNTRLFLQGVETRAYGESS